MANEMEINGKKVLARSKEEFSYDGVEALKLKELNESLFNEVVGKVAYYLDNKEAIEKQQREEAQRIRLEENTKLHVEFLAQLKPLLPADVGVNSFNLENGRVKEAGLLKEGVQVNVEFEDKVWGTWHKYKTNKPWKVIADYKTVRYATLEKAVTSALKKLDEAVELKRERKQAKNKILNEEQMIQQFAEDSGFEFEKNWKGRNYEDGYTYSMKKGFVTANLVVNDGGVKITSYKVYKAEQAISLEEVKRCVE